MDYTYDNLGQLKSAKGKEANGLQNRGFEQLGYAYDAAGNLNIRTNNQLVQTFNVNSLNELTTVTRSGTLHVAGVTTTTATNVTVNGQTAALYADDTFSKGGFSLADGNNTFTAIGNNAAGFSDTNTVTVDMPATNTMVYDLNGNLRTNGNQILEYDDENRLVTNWVPSSWKSEFVYDGSNRRRIQRDYRWSSGVWAKTNESRLVYDDNVPIQHRDTNNVPTLTLTRGLDLSGSFQGAGGIGGLLAMTEASGTSSYYHNDGGGNVTTLINANQLIVGKYSYDSFGSTLSTSGPKAPLSPYRFSSKPQHELSGKYDFLERWYLPEPQRFANRDPIGEAAGINLYAYVMNSPINYVDPLGLSEKDVNKLFSWSQNVTDGMTLRHQRFDIGWVNNAVGSIDWVQNYVGMKLGVPDSKPYLGCGQQAEKLALTLDGLITDDRWEFMYVDDTLWWGAPHQYVVAKSSNPNDPKLVLDPWANKFVRMDGIGTGILRPSGASTIQKPSMHGSKP